MINRNGVGVCAGRLLVVCCLCLAVRVSAEPIPLKRVVDLALTHATTTAIAAADEQRAFQSYRELHNNYIPQLSVGSGLGKSWGYPLSLEGSAPALFNTTVQSAVFNPALRQFLKAARAEWQASTSQTRDQRNAVIQDTVLSYAELNKWEQRIGRLREEQAAGEKLEEAIAERVTEGVESPLENTKARLSSARTRLRLAEAEGSADVLREHLSKLTGQPASSIETIADSIPPFPSFRQDEDLQTSAETSSPVVQSAMEHARAQYLRAQGEHKMFWPTLDFAAQYALLATFNNYDRFFQPNSFQANNATIGVAIRFPFFSPTQSAHAKAADAEALKARKQAEATKNQVSEETLKLQRAVRQMEAAQEVAQLEYEVSKSNLDAVQTRVDAGTATMKDLGESRAQASEHYLALQDTTFELQRARVGLMRSTGELEKWINGSN
ncbi:MAG: TolC family protein [Terriglobales bacterium]